ncbi:MAG: hypothetical protein LUE64_00425, partial [Candidatus Gastranaerophilales bacterium]|nr:hypothetical protein [Candidatus Gastranaerophilales bacterium]
VNVSDTDFNKNALLAFYNNLIGIKEKIRNFYIEQSKKMGISYEFVTSFDDFRAKNDVEIIKRGEYFIRRFYNNFSQEKSRLINLIIFACKISAINLSKLGSFKEAGFEYYFEILRLLALVNYTGTREAKFVRRIKEFSEIAFEIQRELDNAYEEKFGKIKEISPDRSIFEGKSILVSGGNLDELYNLLKNAPDLNIYIMPNMVSALYYPVFNDFSNLKGIYGSGDFEYDFSNFKGAIYLTKNSSISLDNAFRGKIFTTKEIPQEKAIKINPDDLSPLIEAARGMEGFKTNTENEKIHFETVNIQEKIEENRGKKILISFGDEDNFLDYSVLKLDFPLQSKNLYSALDISDNKNTAVYFANCTFETIGLIVTVLNKNLHKIYLNPCRTTSINPHITESLQKDFGVVLI